MDWQFTRTGTQAPASRSTRPWLLDGTNAKSPSRGQQMFTKVALAFHVQGVTFPRARATDPIFARLR